MGQENVMARAIFPFLGGNQLCLYRVKFIFIVMDKDHLALLCASYNFCRAGTEPY